MKTKIPFKYLISSLLMAVIITIQPLAYAGDLPTVAPKNMQPFKLLTTTATTNLISLTASSNAGNTQPKPNLLPECAIAIVVIVVGAIVIVNLVHLCQKVLPPPSTNSPPTNADSNIIFHSPSVKPMDGLITDTNVYAAWFTVEQDMATDLDSSAAIVIPSGVTLTTNGAIPWIQTPTAPSPSTFVTLSNYLSQIQALYGLSPGSNYALIGTTAYSVNGQPTSNIPNIVWDFSGGTGLTVTNGGAATYTAIYERISDLTTTNWIPFFTNTVSAGQTIYVEDNDAPAQAGFYRVILQTN